jgi:hypothetical protein
MMRFRYARHYFQKYGNTDEITQMGTHNKSSNGRCAWVALHAHPARMILDSDYLNETHSVTTD